MSDYKKSTGKSVFKQIATWLGIVLLAVILLGGAVMLLTESQKDSFYVQYNGKKYSSDTITSTPLAPAYRYSFEIRTFLGKKKDYTVKITANPETNFSFTVDGENYRFYSGDNNADDYTEFFRPEASDSTTILNIPQNTSIITALQSKYGEKDIQILHGSQESDCFRLTFTSGNEQVIFTFGLSMQIFAIEIQPEGIVF